ncbi:hypothetical protein IMSAG192_01293 [Muribaculaceae bacterium]|nr:hypothetical protein IMSAG192_01293 [Muribaculaceae bacterium]
MLSNRVKRNIWLTLTILSFLMIPDRCARVVNGITHWWTLLVTIALFAICEHFYMCYRKQVKRGNLFGRVKIFR